MSEKITCETSEDAMPTVTASYRRAHQLQTHVRKRRWLYLVSVSSSLLCSDQGYKTDAAMALPYREHPKRNARHLGRRSFFSIRGSAPPLDMSLASSARNCTSASSDTTSSWTPELPVVYTNSPGVASRWFSDNVPSEGGVLGFDLESVPNCPWVLKQASFEGPATVQFATPHSALVIHLAKRTGHRSKSCAPVLEAVLSDPTIVKAGVGIDHDMIGLYAHVHHMEIKSRFDMGGIGSQDGQSVSLKRLTKSIVGVNMKKSKKMAMSNWSRVPLSDSQLVYSARDAWAGAAVMDRLARYDRETFGTQALIGMLENERPMRDLHLRSKRRKQAKRHLTYLLKLLGSPHYEENDNEPLPTSVRTQIRRLQRLLRDLPPERLVVHDIEKLGLRVH